LRIGANVAIFAGSGGVASARQSVMHHELVKRRSNYVQLSRRACGGAPIASNAAAHQKCAGASAFS